MYELIVLFEGYSKYDNNKLLAGCTCTLLKGPRNIIIDTLSAWDGNKLIEALHKNNLSCDDINYVICTHGHSDHIGCNYLFLKATHIVGFTISHQNTYFDHDFKSGVEYILDSFIKIIPTPGHTLQDVTVLITSDNESNGKQVVAVTGDLFEREEDLLDDKIWRSVGSDNESLQVKHRNLILKVADWIIPGHGPMFKVSESHKMISE